MADVSASLHAEVASDRTWLGVLWVGLAKHGAASLDGVQTSPDHAHNWARGHVLDKTWEEWASRQILVVLLQERLSWLKKLTNY